MMISKTLAVSTCIGEDPNSKTTDTDKQARTTIAEIIRQTDRQTDRDKWRNNRVIDADRGSRQTRKQIVGDY